ncbi:MAG: acyl-ACP--UDP-N-acetylglucosamine O-acyltransferase [Spirochaetia bacterium]|nr:acyl-ACP--UDP-N-acetylglucosamine O-acyltransferase [Spirochaetia bacterium]
MAKIHATALVDKKALLADDVEIGAFSIIGPDVTIGAGCKIGNYVEIKGKVDIGENNEFYHSCFIGEKPQDLTVTNPKPFIKIGNSNIFREFSTVHMPSKEGNATEVGNNNFIMGTVHLGHDVKLENNVILVQGCVLGGYVHVENYAYIGGLAAIHQFCRIGAYSIVGGSTKVVKDIPPYIMADGSPNTAIGINRIGLQRKGFSQSETTAIRKAYKILYRKGISVPTALEMLKNDLLISLDSNSIEYQRIDYFINFIQSSERGIAPHALR